MVELSHSGSLSNACRYKTVARGGRCRRPLTQDLTAGVFPKLHLLPSGGVFPVFPRRDGNTIIARRHAGCSVWDSEGLPVIALLLRPAKNPRSSTSRVALEGASPLHSSILNEI
ncbi:MAG: hypothetical protein QXL15_05115 [Candidatus Korarchaeota archaeon]